MNRKKNNLLCGALLRAEFFFHQASVLGKEIDGDTPTQGKKSRPGNNRLQNAVSPSPGTRHLPPLPFIWLSVIRELEVDSKVYAFQTSNHCLKIISGFSTDPDAVPLNLRLNLQLRPFDFLSYFFCNFR